MKCRLEDKMGKFGKELIGSLQQAAKHAAGKNVRGLRLSKRNLTGKALIAAMQASPDRDTDLAATRKRTRMPVRKVSLC